MSERYRIKIHEVGVMGFVVNQTTSVSSAMALLVSYVNDGWAFRHTTDQNAIRLIKPDGKFTVYFSMAREEPAIPPVQEVP